MLGLGVRVWGFRGLGVLAFEFRVWGFSGLGLRLLG